MSRVGARLRASELRAHWQALAADEGLEAGDPDLAAAGLPDRGPLALHDRATCDRVLDALLGDARRRRPFARIVGREPLTIVVDPQGGDDSEATMAELVGLLRDAHAAARRGLVVDELDRDRALPRSHRLGLARIARRFGVSPTTVKRWAHEAGGRRVVIASGPSEAADGPLSPVFGLQDRVSGGRGRTVRRAS